MITEDQTGVIDFLAAPSTHGGETVERIDTHASIVFLAGSRAYKLKRAVRFDYLDFSTSERRPRCVRWKFASIGGRRRRFIVEWSPSLARMTDRMRSGGTIGPLTGSWR